MISIINFALFLILVNIAPHVYYYLMNGKLLAGFEVPFIPIVSIITFICFLNSFASRCNCKLNNYELLESKNEEGFILSLKILFISLLVINIIFFIILSGGHQGELVIMVAVIPVSLAICISYYVFNLIVYPISTIIYEIIKWVRSLTKK